MDDTNPDSVRDAMEAAAALVEADIHRSGWDQPHRIYTISFDDTIDADELLAADIAGGSGEAFIQHLRISLVAETREHPFWALCGWYAPTDAIGAILATEGWAGDPGEDRTEVRSLHLALRDGTEVSYIRRRGREPAAVRPTMGGALPQALRRTLRRPSMTPAEAATVPSYGTLASHLYLSVTAAALQADLPADDIVRYCSNQIGEICRRLPSPAGAFAPVLGAAAALYGADSDAPEPDGDAIEDPQSAAARATGTDSQTIAWRTLARWADGPLFRAELARVLITPDPLAALPGPVADTEVAALKMTIRQIVTDIAALLGAIIDSFDRRDPDPGDGAGEPGNGPAQPRSG